MLNNLKNSRGPGCWRRAAAKRLQGYTVLSQMLISSPMFALVNCYIWLLFRNIFPILSTFICCCLMKRYFLRHMLSVLGSSKYIGMPISLPNANFASGSFVSGRAWELWTNMSVYWLKHCFKCQKTLTTPSFALYTLHFDHFCHSFLSTNANVWP